MENKCVEGRKYWPVIHFNVIVGDRIERPSVLMVLIADVSKLPAGCVFRDKCNCSNGNVFRSTKHLKVFLTVLPNVSLVTFRFK